MMHFDAVYRFDLLVSKVVGIIWLFVLSIRIRSGILKNCQNFDLLFLKSIFNLDWDLCFRLSQKTRISK